MEFWQAVSRKKNIDIRRMRHLFVKGNYFFTHRIKNGGIIIYCLKQRLWWCNVLMLLGCITNKKWSIKSFICNFFLQDLGKTWLGMIFPTKMDSHIYYINMKHTTLLKSLLHLVLVMFNND